MRLFNIWASFPSWPRLFEHCLVTGDFFCREDICLHQCCVVVYQVLVQWEWNGWTCVTHCNCTPVTRTLYAQLPDALKLTGRNTAYFHSVSDHLCINTSAWLQFNRSLVPTLRLFNRRFNWELWMQCLFALVIMYSFVLSVFSTHHRQFSFHRTLRVCLLLLAVQR